MTVMYLISDAIHSSQGLQTCNQYQNNQWEINRNEKILLRLSGELEETPWQKQR